MTTNLTLSMVHTARDRAHQYGADWVVASKEGDHQMAESARRRYFRELEAIDILMGNTPSPFAGLG